MTFKVFFSYTHRDEQLLEKLKEHLAPLKNQGLIDRFWHDREISAGTEWEPEIVKHIDTADIILLLVSAGFMNSDYCYGKELQRAIKRHERKEARVIPIILSPVDWEIPPLDKLQALPTNAKPVTGAGWHSVDEALLNVVKGIRVVVNELQKRPRPGSLYQYQVNYISEQIKQGTSVITALYQCDPELGKLFEWIISISSYVSTEDITTEKAKMEKLLQEVAAVGEGDLRVYGEVTPDTLGVIADCINYTIEELANLVNRTRSITTQVISDSNHIIKTIEEQKQITSNLARQFDVIMKSQPERSHAQQFSTITMLMSELFKRFDVVGNDIKNIGDDSHQLRESTSAFRLPGRVSEQQNA